MLIEGRGLQIKGRYRCLSVRQDKGIIYSWWESINCIIN